MKRKYVGEVSKRYTVFKHVSQWDGNFRCGVWELVYQNDDKQKAFDYFRESRGGFYELRDESLETCKTIAATC